MKMYKENFGFNRFNKKMMLSIFSVCIFFFVAFLSVGFSAFENDLIINNFSARVNYEEDVARVYNFQPCQTDESTNNGGRASNTDYNYNRLIGDIRLPNDNSTVLYEVKVINLGSSKVGILDIISSNPNLDYELTGYNFGDKIMNEDGQYSLGTIMTFYITIKYAEGATVTNELQPFNMLIEFRQFYTVTYRGVPGQDEFPVEIMQGTDLVLNTELKSIDRLKVTENTAFLTYGEDYIYDESLEQLTVINVEGDLVLSYKDIAYLSNLSSLDAFFKEPTYRNLIESIHFVSYVDLTNVYTDANGYQKIYPLDTAGDNSILGWLEAKDDSSGMFNLYIGSVYDIYTLNFEHAFSYMTGLKTITFENLNTSLSTSFSHTFYRTKVTSLDLSTFNTKSATDMSAMFSSMTNLESLDIRHFSTENVTSMSNMFYRSYKAYNIRC